MSSAEDTRSLTASPPAESADSSVAEPEPANIAQSDPASSVAHPDEPGEDAVAQAQTKPLPKVNATAHEARVTVTGARPGNAPGERELFTESTTTVLVFEKGGVLRLTAAVAPGQLLFLSNEETKREVVAQVTRKRAHRPTDCYVELEFTEPAPKFWGMEFSAATALLPKDAKQVEAAALVASAETTTDEPGEAAFAPTPEEVLALKKEVEALRGQQNLSQAPGEAAQTAPAAESTESSPTSAAAGVMPETAFAAISLPVESEPRPAELTPAEQELLPKASLDFSMSLPKRKKRSFRARGNFTPGFRSGMLRLALLSLALVITIIGAAWYKHWLPWKPAARKIEVSSWATPVTTGPAPGAVTTTPGTTPVLPGNGKAGTDTPASSIASSQKSATGGGNPVGQMASGEHAMDSSAPNEGVVQPAERRKPVAIATTPKRSSARAPATVQPDSAPVSAAEPAIVPPKLIRSARAVASLDDLRDFETGAVIIDAIVDATGNIFSMNVLSGPPSLRQPAMEAFKNYRYEPATRNGKPIPAHVTVRIQFHFE